MNETDRKFWSFGPRTSIALSIAMLVGLLFILTVLKKAGELVSCGGFAIRWSSGGTVTGVR